MAADVDVGYFCCRRPAGWINDENPTEIAKRISAEHNFQTPLDELDAAARVVDPIIAGVAEGIRPFGQFIKDYVETEW